MADFSEAFQVQLERARKQRTLDAYSAAFAACKSQEEYHALKDLVASNELTYSRDFVVSISKLPDAERINALKNLLAIWGPDIRDPNASRDYEHLVQTLILCGWVEGLKLVLEDKPELVNIMALETNAQGGGEPKPKPYPLLMFCWAKQIGNKAILNLLFNDQLNLSLRDVAGNTIFHAIQASDLENTQIIADRYLDRMEDNEGAEEASLIRNNDGLTFEEISKGINHESVRYQSYFGGDPGEAYIHEHFGKYGENAPFMLPDIWAISLAGKALARKASGGDKLNTRLFLSTDDYLEYIGQILLDKEGDERVLNAVVQIDGGTHAICIYSIIDPKKGNIDSIYIDSMGSLMEDGHYDIESDFNQIKNFIEKIPNVKFRTVSNETQFQHSQTGCHVIANYLTGKLSHLDLDEAVALFKQLYDSETTRCVKKTTRGKYDAHKLVDLREFPLKLGVLAICQSLSLIKEERERIQSSQLDEPVNKRNERFDQMLSRGVSHQYKNYVGGGEFKKERNEILFRKIQNQLRFAEKFHETSTMDEEKTRECADILFELLGIKETTPEDEWWDRFDELMIDATKSGVLEIQLKDEKKREIYVPTFSANTAVDHPRAEVENKPPFNRTPSGKLSG